MGGHTGRGGSMGDCTSGVTVSAYLQCLLPSAEGSATVAEALPGF